MPPKNMENLLPMLCVRYPDGHYESLGKIEEVNMEPDIDYDFHEETEYLSLKSTSEMTLSFRWDPSIRTQYLLITGKYPSNNWLKMHGYPMTRQCGYRKRKHRYDDRG